MGSFLLGRKNGGVIIIALLLLHGGAEATGTVLTIGAIGVSHVDLGAI